MKMTTTTLMAVSLMMLTAGVSSLHAVGVGGTWSGSSTTDGNWTTDANNWVGGTIPNSTGTATFGALTGTWSNVAVDTATLTVGQIEFTGNATSYTFNSLASTSDELASTGGTYIYATALTNTSLVTETFNTPIVFTSSSTVQINNGSTNGTGAGSAVFVLNGNISTTSSGAPGLELRGTNNNANTVSGLISNGSGTLALIKADVGTWYLTNSGNSFTGGVNISSGLLNVSSVGALGGSTTSTLQMAQSVAFSSQDAAAYGILQYSGSTGTVSNPIQINNSAAITNGGIAAYADLQNTSSGQTITFTGPVVTNGTAGLATLGLGGVGNGAVTGAISGDVGVAATGTAAVVISTTTYTPATATSGTWTLSGSNSYTGPTTVSGGATLYMNNTSGAGVGTGTLTVSAGSTFGGSGIDTSLTKFTIGAGTATFTQVQVGTGGTDATSTLTLAASSASTITKTNLTFNLSSTTLGQGNQLVLNNGATGTSLSFGTGTSASTLTLNIVGGGIVAPDTSYVLITDNSGFSGLTTNSNGVITGGLSIAASQYFGAPSGGFTTGFYNGSYLYLTDGGDQIDVMVVPEPKTWAMLFAGLGMLLYWQRRTKSRN